VLSDERYESRAKAPFQLLVVNWSAKITDNSPAKPLAMPERIEAVLQLRESRRRITTISSRSREVLKEIAMSQDLNHLNHATWECKYHVVFTHSIASRHPDRAE
jgi:hypothetical protein